MKRRDFIVGSLAGAASISIARALPIINSITIDCDVLNWNTTHNPAWLVGYDDMVYRYPKVPLTGQWSGGYTDLMRLCCADIEKARKELRLRVWQRPDILSGDADRIATVGDHEEYEVDMPYWRATSRCWLYRSTTRRTGWLLIVHGGHANHGPLHQDLVPIRLEALAAGHDVLVVSMPGQSVNQAPGPYPWMDRFNGPMTSHQNLPLFDRSFLARTWRGNPFGIPPESGLHVFLAPVTRMINTIGHQYDGIALTGLSGGATTAIRCAALDTRIMNLYAVAGSGCAPRHMYYKTPSFFGDNEDQLRTWLEVANEEETWQLLGDRRSVIINNDKDPVYCGGVDMSFMKDATCYSGVEFRVDVNNKHSWSPATRAFIIKDLA